MFFHELFVCIFKRLLYSLLSVVSTLQNISTLFADGP
jgi:hypothetical protein